MIKITNGIRTIEVTSGAYDSIYRHQGYKPIGKNASVEEKVGKPPEQTDDEKFLEQVIEKPISQWTKNDVKRYAALKEIDISGTKNVNEAKAIIKDTLDAEELNAEENTEEVEENTEG